jgi:hypothetical protein
MLCLRSPSHKGQIRTPTQSLAKLVLNCSSASSPQAKSSFLSLTVI